MISQTDLLAPILAGLAIWGATGIANFLLKRYYLCKALLSDVRKQSERVIQLKDYLLAFIAESLKPGQVIDLSARFTKTNNSFLDDIRHELIQLLPHHLQRVFDFYEAAEELDILTENFFTEVTIWKNEQHSLSESDHLYLLAKVGRIIRLAELLNSKPIHRLSDLPESYGGRVDATRVLELTQRVYAASQKVEAEVVPAIIPGLYPERRVGRALNPGPQADG